MPASAAASRTRGGICSCGTSWFSRLNATSSATVSPTNWLLVSCSTVPTTAAVRTSGTVAGSLPATRIEPVAVPRWRCGIIPLIALISVDFPEPDAPTTAIFSPRRTTRSTSWRVGSDCARYWKE